MGYILLFIFFLVLAIIVMPLLRIGFEFWRMHRRMRKLFNQAQGANQQTRAEQPRQKRQKRNDTVGKYVAFEEIPDDGTTPPHKPTTPPYHDPIITDVEFEEIK